MYLKFIKGYYVYVNAPLSFFVAYIYGYKLKVV